MLFLYLQMGPLLQNPAETRAVCLVVLGGEVTSCERSIQILYSSKSNVKILSYKWKSCIQNVTQVKEQKQNVL